MAPPMSHSWAQSLPISIETLWQEHLQALSEPTPRGNRLTYLMQDFSIVVRDTSSDVLPQCPLCVLVCLGGCLFSLSFISPCKEQPFHPSPGPLSQFSLPIVNQEPAFPYSKFCPLSLGQSTESCQHICDPAFSLLYILSTLPSLCFYCHSRAFRRFFNFSCPAPFLIHLHG